MCSWLGQLIVPSKETRQQAPFAALISTMQFAHHEMSCYTEATYHAACCKIGYKKLKIISAVTASCLIFFSSHIC